LKTESKYSYIRKFLTVLKVVGMTKLRENSFKSCHRNRKRACILNMFLWQGLMTLLKKKALRIISGYERAEVIGY